jgi:ABC-type sugar transport system permease subunit
VYATTRGGPANATEVLGTVAFAKGIRGNQVGYGAAITMLITALSLITSYILIQVRKRTEY